MIANATTLIIGAGANFECGYPTGAGLRELILQGSGFNAEILEDREWRYFADTFRRSTVPSIDAFLAEPENERFRKVGLNAIALALLPCEANKKDEPPPWVSYLFDAIRGRASGVRKHSLKVITFNYDLSLEYYLFHAFKATYALDNMQARAIVEESVKIIHVYGQLGQIHEYGSDGAHVYGSNEFLYNEEEQAANGIKIIGREPDSAEFTSAHDVIRDADFIGILGFGYDQTNVDNLKLVELLKGKNVFSTGYDMGYGVRGWIRHLGIGPLFFGSPKHTVSDFLWKSGFLRWADKPGLKSDDLMNAIKNTGVIDSVMFHM